MEIIGPLVAAFGGATLFGTLLGVYLGARLNFDFQKRLVDQQLEFQQKLLDQQLAHQSVAAEADAAWRAKAFEDMREIAVEFRNMVNVRLREVGKELRGGNQ